MTSLAVKISIIYSSSIENRVIVAYYLEYQLFGLLFSMKMNQNIDFQLFLLPAQFESKYFLIFSCSLPLYIISQYFDLLRYLRIVLTTLISQYFGFLVKRLNNDVAKVILDLVSIIENIIYPIIFQYLLFFDGKISPFLHKVSIVDSLLGILTSFTLLRQNF